MVRTRDLPACSIVPQPTTLSRAPFWFQHVQEIKLALAQYCTKSLNYKLLIQLLNDFSLHPLYHIFFSPLSIFHPIWSIMIDSEMERSSAMLIPRTNFVPFISPRDKPWNNTLVYLPSCSYWYYMAMQQQVLSLLVFYCNLMFLQATISYITSLYSRVPHNFNWIYSSKI
jgi:hypothetical protein